MRSAIYRSIDFGLPVTARGSVWQKGVLGVREILLFGYSRCVDG